MSVMFTKAGWTNSPHLEPSPSEHPNHTAPFIEVIMKKFFGLTVLGFLFVLNSCAPVTLVRANIASDFTRQNVSSAGIIEAPIQAMNYYSIIGAGQRSRIDDRISRELQSMFGERTAGGADTLRLAREQNLDGELLAALNQYDLRGTLRPESLDRVLEALDMRYMVLPRMQHAASELATQWFFFPSIESSATLNLAVYDRQNRRIVTDIITNGFATKGFFGGGLIDAALDQSLSTALSVLKSRVR